MHQNGGLQLFPSCVVVVHPSIQILILRDKLFHSEHSEAVKQTALRGHTVKTKLEQCKMNLKWCKGYCHHDTSVQNNSRVQNRREYSLSNLIPAYMTLFAHPSVCKYKELETSFEGASAVITCDRYTHSAPISTHGHPQPLCYHSESNLHKIPETTQKIRSIVSCTIHWNFCRAKPLN